MKKTFFLIFVLILMLNSSFAISQNPEILKNPNLHYFPAQKEKATGKTVVILPGGGYAMHAMDHEGFDWVEFFNNEGVNVAILQYKLPEGDFTLPLNDVKETFVALKENSEALDIDPSQIGIMGFSAGGHLASTYATHSEGSEKPAFQILFYPVISLTSDLTHEGSRDNFLGSDQSDDRIILYSNEYQVTESTPPAILFHSDDDGFVPRENSVKYYLALNQHGVPSSLHIYPEGGHGWGYRESFPYHDVMLQELSVWLKNLNKK